MLTRKETSRVAVTWWQGLQPDPDKNQLGDRAALARLRRCSTITELLFERETQLFLHKCGATSGPALSRAALVAGVLAYVRANRGGVPVARQIGPVEADDEKTALCKPLRFRKLLDTESYDDCLRAFRRLVMLAGGAVNVADMAFALMAWPREESQDELAADRVRRDWVYRYWNTTTLEKPSDNQ